MKIDPCKRIWFPPRRRARILLQGITVPNSQNWRRL